MSRGDNITYRSTQIQFGLGSGRLCKMVGGIFAAKASTQRITTQSTLEAELVSMACANKEAVYILNMLNELGQGDTFNRVLLLHRSIAHWGQDSTYSSKSKHRVFRFSLLREVVKKDNIILHHACTQD